MANCFYHLLFLGDLDVNWSFGWRLLTASNSSFVSPLTVLTISSTYLRNTLVSDEWLMQSDHFHDRMSTSGTGFPCYHILCYWFAWNHLLQTSHSTPLERAVTRCSQLRQVLDCVLVLHLGVCNFSCGSHDFIQSFAKIPAKNAPIANPSFWQYQLLLHLKWTLVTANSSRRFIVVLLMSGLLSLA